MRRKIRSTIAIAVFACAGIFVAACDNTSTSRTITGPSIGTPDTVSIDSVPGSQIKSHSIVGHVMMADAPTTAITGARVLILSGPDAGRVTLTDSGGGFFFSKIVAGQIALEVSHAGFQSWTSKTWFLDRDMTIDPQLSSGQ